MTIVSDSSGRKTPANLMTVQLESTEPNDITAELATIPVDASVGSTAYTKDGKHFFLKDESGGWNDWLAESATVPAP